MKKLEKEIKKDYKENIQKYIKLKIDITISKKRILKNEIDYWDKFNLEIKIEKIESELKNYNIY